MPLYARISQLGFFRSQNEMDLAVNTGRIVCGCWKIHSALLSPPSLDSTGMGMHQRQVKSLKSDTFLMPSCLLAQVWYNLLLGNREALDPGIAPKSVR